jgi:predicted O-methyltransferase YrrM
MAADFITRAGKRDEGSYLPSFEFDGQFVDELQPTMPDTVRDIPGWLRDEDVLKLYELASLTHGPILEIGSYQGKSSVVLATALERRGRPGRMISVDIDPEALASARARIRDQGLAARVSFVQGTSRALTRAVPGLRPSLVFVDGDHSEAGVRRDLAVLESRVPDGGLLLFHDYLDDRNADPAEKHMGVVQGVAESWVAAECDFAGVFGCCALFRRRSGGPGPPAPVDLSHLAARSEDGLPPLIDLTARDDLRMRYLQRVRRPLGRWARRRLGRERAL